MSAKKKWKGITTNFCIFQGEVISDPSKVGDYWFLTLRTTIVQTDANGQIVEVDQDVPLMVEPGSQNINVVNNYVKEGRKLQAWCHYKSWLIDGVLQHAFVIRKIDLGDKPYEAKE